MVGAAVALFDWVTRERIFDEVYRAPVALAVVAPGLGLLLSAVCLRWLAHGASPASTDAVVRAYHDRERHMDERPVLGRLAASIATLGAGGALGYEGPSLYLGAATGSTLQRRLSRYFGREDAKLLLIAGAAAGVAAIFKAPATGVVFALELPYQDDLARRMLLPASIAAAASYVTFAGLAGTTPILAVSGSPPFDLRDLGGALVVGVLAGIGARLFSSLLLQAKQIGRTVRPFVRIGVAAVVLAGLALGAQALFEEMLTLGAGYRSLSWALDPERGLLLIGALFAMRALATAVTLGGGGVGGVFIPLAVQGALLGRVMGGVFDAATSTLFPLIGMAAFLGAGYRTPLAAVMFVAESTGRPGFVVPGLIAAVSAQLVMGRVSVSPYQVASRAGHLERRFTLPISSALRTDLATAPPDTTVSELFWHHLVGTRQRSVPVVDGHTYLGMVTLGELRDTPQGDWGETPISAVMRTDLPVGSVSWLLRDAIAAMEEADTDRLPVVDADGRYVGLVTTSQILKLDEILDEAT